MEADSQISPREPSPARPQSFTRCQPVWDPPVPLHLQRPQLCPARLRFHFPFSFFPKCIFGRQRCHNPSFLPSSEGPRWQDRVPAASWPRGELPVTLRGLALLLLGTAAAAFVLKLRCRGGGRANSHPPEDLLGPSRPSARAADTSRTSSPMGLTPLSSAAGCNSLSINKEHFA